MRGYTPEQEMILIARGVAEIADAVEAQGTPMTGHGVAYSRSLIRTVDAGTRGTSASEHHIPAPPVDRNWPPPPREVGVNRAGRPATLGRDPRSPS